jgi:hypothetical protein
MLGQRHQFQVLNAIVHLIAIAMMDNLVSVQPTAQILFHDKAMLVPGRTISQLYFLVLIWHPRSSRIRT